ncbi:gastric triacylglycerol lipase-like isoform X1 [Frankliniella occidentalis]|uniref:Gastric triacylglycerol lipase-like isoform X1 n=1 Tax=Frankliniella occidentalis TaxID=133901 RepID=A0A6J1T9C1_FRAOC|nr:gastric triacylglycerol lipase-like isoform X1 [Frankliniella occidentalis]XP_052128120.1 gastric triacylglycerol lipase-like isoform X1 [Frankliniella occidentalis]
MRTATFALLHLLLVLGPSRPSAAHPQSIPELLLSPLLDPVENLLPGLGSIVASLSPYFSVLNPILQSSLQNNLTQFSSDVVTSLTSVVGALANVSLPVPPIIRPDREAPKFGFTSEAYNVTTSDGYILEFFRLRSGNCTAYRAVVVLPPGILSNAASFILLKENSLAYRLARRCYDVWLLTFRGYLFGRRHTTLSDTSAQFWDFYPYHWGAYDLPAQLEFVSNKTGSIRLRLIGVDQAGTALLFMNHVHRQKFQGLLAGCYIMGPIGYFGRLRSLAFATLALLRDVIKAVGAITLHNELAFMNPAVHSVVYNLCGRISPLTCFYLFQLLAGNTNEINYRLFPYMFANILDSTSIDTLVYYNQQVGRVKYMAFLDYGTTENLRRYNQSTPVNVDLTATTVPCSFYALKQGTVVVTEDVRDTFRALAKTAQSHYEELANYSNVGPLFAVNTDGIYGRIISRLEIDLLNETTS